MKPVNLTKTLKGYYDGWVAISKDYKQVLYHGKNFVDLMRKVEKDKKQNQVILFPAAENYRGFGGMGLLGQETVFDKFKIVFERYNWQFQITPYK